MRRQISNKKVLTLGAGSRVNIGAINHDKTKCNKYIDVVWDLDKLPWPWSDNSFIFIEARSVLEHLEIGLIKAMNECWRIMKSEGCIFIKLPNWESKRCWDDPTHKRGFTIDSLNYLDPDTEFGKYYDNYTPYKWKILTKCYGSNAHTAFLSKLQIRKK